MISAQKLRSLVSVTVESDALVTAVRDAVVQDFITCTRRLWIADTITTVIQPADKYYKYVFLPIYPITELGISERAVAEDDWTPLEVDVDYEADLATGLLTNLRSTWAKYIQVVVKGGYADDACPADILYALALEIRRTLARDSEDAIAMTSERDANGNVTARLDPNLKHPMYRRCIEKYKKRASN